MKYIDLAELYAIIQNFLHDNDYDALKFDLHELILIKDGANFFQFNLLIGKPKGKYAMLLGPIIDRIYNHNIRKLTVLKHENKSTQDNS